MVPARGLKARAMSSEENPYIYVFKPKLMGMVHELALTQDSLDWVIGPGSGRVSYHMIKRIRLGYKPTNMANARFIAEIWPLNAPKLTIYSVSARSLVDMANQGGDYVRFISELHRRMSAAKANCVYEAGFPAWRWWPAAIFALATVLAVAYIAVQAVIAAQYMLAGIIVLIGAWFLWQIWNIVKRNRPRQYTPDAIPEDVLPNG
ncbi:MAG: hypothetical protein IPK23_05850 [Rhizobiales bacterium]|jgi:hypothetical protein|nr:hypothetical protein [Hyphomicrobiales bacterium]